MPGIPGQVPDALAVVAVSRARTRWEFPKIEDPNIVPYTVGSLLSGLQNKVPLIFGNSQVRAFDRFASGFRSAALYVPQILRTEPYSLAPK